MPPTPACTLPPACLPLSGPSLVGSGLGAHQTQHLGEGVVGRVAHPAGKSKLCPGG